MKDNKNFEISPGLDKMDSYMVPRENFYHDSYFVSGRGPFHQTTGYAYRDFHGPSHYMGTNKKAWKVSGEGYNIDSRGSRIGKSDE